VYALALGYEDLNDHHQLRQDPLMGVLAGTREADQPLASKSTLCRPERTPAAGDRRAVSFILRTAVDLVP